MLYRGVIVELTSSQRFNKYRNDLIDIRDVANDEIKRRSRRKSSILSKHNSIQGMTKCFNREIVMLR